MNLDERINELGGVKPAIGGNFTPMDESGVSNLEGELNAELPENYRAWLLQYGAAVFNEYIEFKVAKGKTVMDLMRGEDYSEVRYLPLSVLYGSDVNLHSLERNMTVYEGRMPENFIPIGDDGFGNQICLGIGGDEKGKIYYWDHENEWDEEDYEEDYDEPMPPEMKFQNVYFVAHSFDDFFEQLRIGQI